MSDNPALSVIIPSYRSSRTIRSCLDSLLKQDFYLPYEIIFVDSSDDRTPDIVLDEYPKVQLIHLPERTDPALARNIGAEKARAQILAFIDSDCSAAPGWMSGLYHAFHLGYDAVGGAVANANGESLVSWAGYFSEFREFLPYGPAKEVFNLTLGNAAYSSQAFWKAGGFPVGCFPQEDQVFHQTFRQCGFRILFDPAIQIFHNHRTKINDYLNHQRQIGQANARVVRQLDLPGKNLARSPWLARLSLPALVSLRWVRTLWACRYVEDGLVWKHPQLAGLLVLGMMSWGKGFIEEASHARQGC